MDNLFFPPQNPDRSWKLICQLSALAGILFFQTHISRHVEFFRYSGLCRDLCFDFTLIIQQSLVSCPNLDFKTKSSWLPVQYFPFPYTAYHNATEASTPALTLWFSTCWFFSLFLEPRYCVPFFLSKINRYKNEFLTIFSSEFVCICTDRILKFSYFTMCHNKLCILVLLTCEHFHMNFIPNLSIIL